MKKSLLTVVLILVVTLMGVPAFAAKTESSHKGCGKAFGFLYGVVTPGPGSPVQMTGGDMPAAHCLGETPPAQSPGTPVAHSPGAPAAHSPAGTK